MTRYGQQYGPDFTFLGVDRCDLDDESTFADADVPLRARMRERGFPPESLR